MKLYRWIISPKIRYSKTMDAIRHIFEPTNQEKALNSALAMVKGASVDGDYLEFGVYKGNTFRIAYHLAQKKGLDMKFYAFDSFEGLPKLKGKDAKGFKHFNEGQFAFDEYSFRDAIIKMGVDLNKVKVVKGFYNKLNDDTKLYLDIKKASVVYIDCDLYESTKDALNFVKSYLQTGTVIVFDDWHGYKSNPKRGEQGAFNNFLKKNKDITAVPFQRFGGNASFVIHVEGMD